jgi:hypothetical protein
MKIKESHYIPTVQVKPPQNNTSTSNTSTSSEEKAATENVEPQKI